MSRCSDGMVSKLMNGQVSYCIMAASEEGTESR